MSTVSTLNLNDTSGGGAGNFSIAYENVKAEDVISLANNDASGFAGTFRVVSSVDNGTYWTFTVTPLNVVGSFVAGDDYDLYVISAGGAAAGGAYGLGNWDWASSALLTDPGTGNIAADSGSLGFATALYINVKNSNTNLDYYEAFAELVDGDHIVLREDDGGKEYRWTVNGTVTDNTTWFNIPVTLEDQGTGSIGSSATFTLQFIKKAGRYGSHRYAHRRRLHAAGSQPAP